MCRNTILAGNFVAKAFVICLITLSSATVLGQYAEFDFDKKVVKFDPAQEGFIFEHNFYFTNTGDAPLEVSSHEVECDCIQLIYPEGPVGPGERGYINMTFDSSGKSGWQYREIVIHANTRKKSAELELRVKVLN
jgi:hypothetical protein